MILPSKLDLWCAEAVVRVYEPWLTSTCIGINARQRREVADLVDRARRLVGRSPAAPAARPRAHSVRSATGRWRPEPVPHGLPSG